MKAILDTNVLVSAFLFPGATPEGVYRAALEGRIELVTSRPLLVELGRLLASRFGWEDPWVEEAVAQVARVGTVVEPGETVRVAADPADDRVLEAALAGAIEVVVSGHHPLRLRSWRGIKIVDATTFLSRLA